MFNKFLKEMKSDFIGTRYSAFWSKVVGESISLVTSNESGESSVSQEDAKQVHADGNTIVSRESTHGYSIFLAILFAHLAFIWDGKCMITL